MPLITREANGVTISGTITPTVLEWPYLRLVATGLGYSWGHAFAE